MSARQGARRKPSRELRRERRPHRHRCWDHLIVAPLWAAYGENLGTLLRTCDAVGACMAVRRGKSSQAAIERGNTLRIQPCIHEPTDPEAWLRTERERGSWIVGVELADDARRLADVEPAHRRTVIVLGHERFGLPDEAWDHLDQVIEIPMIGTGASLNVAVAGSLVLYKLAGLS
jgi:tRNA (guanosine-2'-O-)-methyltransferase